MKARTSTKSKRKRGRPPLPDLARTPSGQLSRSKAATVVIDIMNKRIGLEARMRVYGASTAQCEDVKWGYLLGRMYLTTSYGIRSHQHEAGVRIAQDYARCYGLCGYPMPHPRALDLFRVHGMAGDADPGAVQKALEKVRAIERLLRPNSAMLSVVKRVCVYEIDDGMWTGYNLALLKAGLELAAVYYGIPIEKDEKTLATSAR